MYHLCFISILIISSCNLIISSHPGVKKRAKKLRAHDSDSEYVDSEDEKIYSGEEWLPTRKITRIRKPRNLNPEDINKAITLPQKRKEKRKRTERNYKRLNNVGYNSDFDSDFGSDFGSDFDSGSGNHSQQTTPLVIPPKRSLQQFDHSITQGKQTTLSNLYLLADAALQVQPLLPACASCVQLPHKDQSYLQLIVGANSTKASSQASSVSPSHISNPKILRPILRHRRKTDENNHHGNPAI